MITIFKAQIGDADYYCDSEGEARAIFDRYKDDNIPCRIWEQVWDEDEDSDEPREDVIASNEEVY